MPRTNRASSLLLVVLLSGFAGMACEQDDANNDIDDAEEALLRAPIVNDISPDSGPIAGGTPVVIAGDYFGRGVTVSFGDAALQVTRVGRNQLRVTAPAHAAGKVDVRVENRNGSYVVLAKSFEYLDTTPPPPPPETDGGTPPPPPENDGGTPPPPPASCALQDSGPVQATADGQVIENLRVTSTSGNAIEVNGYKNVTIRNCEVLHQGGRGIAFSGADGIHIDHVRVVHTGAPASGPNSSDELNNIDGYNSSGVVIEHARVERGSAGVYLVQSPGPKVRFLEGHDIRGPYPRGNLLQFNNCDDALLEDFSVENSGSVSWTEDNVSFYQSGNGIARRGLIIGNNSPVGVGVMMEADDGVGQGGLVEDVDTIDMGNGSFATYPNANVTFRRTRTRDTHCAGQAGRDVPSSNAILFASSPDSSNTRLESGKYFNHCNPSNLVWLASTFSLIDLVEEDFTPRPPQRISLCWSPPPFSL